MIDKYGATPTLQVSQASCLILQGKYEEADKLLQVHIFVLQLALSQGRN
jgi:hypothetical protein